MKKILAFLFCIFTVPSVMASDTYTWIIPTAPGTVSDLVNRSIAAEYEIITGNRLIIENRPGGDFVVGLQRFKNCNDICIIGTGSSVQVVNPLLKKDWQFSDRDFDHVGFVGWIPNVFYVRADSPIKNLNDLRTSMIRDRIKVGISDQISAVNIMSIHEKYKNKESLMMINYKTSVQALQDVISGQVTAGFSGPGEAIISAVESGKIRIIGSSHNQTITIAGVAIPPMGSELGIETFSANQVISITPGRDPRATAKLRKDLLMALRSERVSRVLIKANIQIDGGDGDYSTKIIKQYRQRIDKFVANLSDN